jgi:hypothetical protein
MGPEQAVAGFEEDVMAVGTTARRGIDMLAGLLRIIGLLIVAILVIHIVLVVLDANAANTFAATIASLADTFDLGLSNLFQYSEPKLSVILNYGVAAIIWFVITSVVVRLVRRLG